jgi:hypothetical protein
MNTLYLTPAERAVFQVLSPNVRDSWQVADAKIGYEESERRRRARFTNMNVQDPRLKDIRKRAEKGESKEQLTSVLGKADFSDLNESDMVELFYALGPEIISALILVLLSETKEDADLEQVSAYSSMRHLLFQKP